MNNKFYVQVDLSEHKEIFFENILRVKEGEYIVPTEILDDIQKQSGVSSSLRKILGDNISLLVENIIAGCKYYYGNSIIFLVESDQVVRVSFNKHLPLLNEEFFHVVRSTISDYASLLEESNHQIYDGEYKSEMTIYPREEFLYRDSRYNLGVVLENDELDTVSCKLIVRKDDNLEFYLPSKYFNLSANRYMRTSSDMQEALKQLLLRVVSSIEARENWFSLILEADTNLKNCSKIHATYEEYKSVLRLLSQISVQSDMDEEEYEDLKAQLDAEILEDFTKNYPSIQQKKGSYIWRCSAVGDYSIQDLLDCVNSWRSSNLFYPSCNRYILRLLGEFIMLDRISMNLAKRI